MRNCRRRNNKHLENPIYISTWGLHTKCMICMLRLVHEDHRTWRLFNKCMIWMLQVWVHCAGVSCTIACYVIGTIMFLIVSLNMKYDVIIFIIHNAVFQIWIIWAEFGSSRFFLCMSAVHDEFDWRICSSLTVCLQFQYESSTGTRYLKHVLGLEFSTGNLDWNWELGLEPTHLLWSKQVLR